MLTRMSHTAIVTTDLERARTFYEKTLGLTLVAEFVLDDRGIDKVVQLKDSRIRVTMFRAPQEAEDGPVVELLYYERPASRPIPAEAASNDAGCNHLCFWVDDIDAEYERLRGLGVKFNCEPQLVETGALGKVKVTYFKDPDGTRLELLQVVSQ